MLMLIKEIGISFMTKEMASTEERDTFSRIQFCKETEPFQMYNINTKLMLCVAFFLTRKSGKNL
jgi:hypothetical protein